MQTTQSSKWHVVETCDSSDITEICRFRVEVWREEGQLDSSAFPEGQWRDPIDATAQHWTIRDSQGRLAAAGRLSLHSDLAEFHESHEYQRFELNLAGPLAAPDRVVVASFARGSGLGREILDLQDAAAVTQGATHALRQASPRMVQLLSKRGWHVLGPASSDPRFPGVQFTVIIKEF